MSGHFKNVLAFLGISLAASSASAAIPDASGVIHGCYNLLTGATRIIDGTNCGLLERHVSWSQTGPAGASVTGMSLGAGDPNCPTGGVALTLSGTTRFICNGGQGPQGPQGPVGPQGPQGPQGAGGFSLGRGWLSPDVPATPDDDGIPTLFDDEKFYATKLARCFVTLTASVHFPYVGETPDEFAANFYVTESFGPGHFVVQGQPITLTSDVGSRQGQTMAAFLIHPGTVVSFGVYTATREGTVTDHTEATADVHWICQYIDDDPNYTNNPHHISF